MKFSKRLCWNLPRYLIAGLVLMGMLVPAHAGIQIQSWTTSNGAKVLFVETHTIPVLDVNVDFDAGSRRDPQGKAGLSALTNLLLARGINATPGVHAEKALSEAEILDAFADAGANRGGGVDMDRGSVSLRTLSSPEESDMAIQVLARMLANPAFPAEIAERDKARVIASVREELTQPSAIAGRAFMSELYGIHPYGANATPESLASISLEDIINFHRTHYVADRAVIAIVGDVNRERAEKIANELSIRLNKAESQKLLPALPDVPVNQAKEKLIEHPSAQSHVLIGMPALRRNDPDFFSLTIGNYILGGGGFVSRLMQNIREKRGLSYSVYSYFSPMLQEGPFQIGFQTKQGQTEEAVKIARLTLTDFLEEGVTKKELKAAQDYLVESFPLRIDNNRKILSMVSVIGYYNMPLDYLDTWVSNVKKVTVNDVQTAFRRKIFMEQLTTVIVGESNKTKP